MATAAHITTGEECINTLRCGSPRDLDLSHRSLYDDGCEVLFSWLKTGGVPSEAQFPLSFSTVTLNDIQMGDRGFSALVDWLESIPEHQKIKPSTPCLTSLSLRSNQIHGTPLLADRFITATSFSLTALHISNNTLFPAFRSSLLSSLHRFSALRILEISMTDLTCADARPLASYLSTPGCTLVELTANANLLGSCGVLSIVCALRRNYRIQQVKLFANDLNDEAEHDHKDEDGRGEDESIPDDDILGLHEWVDAAETLASYGCASSCGLQIPGASSALQSIIGRNIVLRHAARCDSLLLFKWSRVLLMRGGSAQAQLSDASFVPLVDAPEPVRASFLALPTELKLYIISLLAPMLSTAQSSRVLQYATETRTLPAVEPSLPTRRPMRPQKPGSLSPSIRETPLRLGKGKRIGSLARATSSASVSVPLPSAALASTSTVHIYTRPHSDDTCPCNYGGKQAKWLQDMGCDVYDAGT